MCGYVRKKKFHTCGFGLYEGGREREEERKERKQKEAKEERRCDTGKKLDEDGKYVVLNVTV